VHGAHVRHDIVVDTIAPSSEPTNAIPNVSANIFADIFTDIFADISLKHDIDAFRREMPTSRVNYAGS
jgi:hypothetical protein